jgi:hypothetical protein
MHTCATVEKTGHGMVQACYIVLECFQGTRDLAISDWLCWVTLACGIPCTCLVAEGSRVCHITPVSTPHTSQHLSIDPPSQVRGEE